MNSRNIAYLYEKTAKPNSQSVDFGPSVREGKKNSAWAFTIGRGPFVKRAMHAPQHRVATKIFHVKITSLPRFFSGILPPAKHSAIPLLLDSKSLRSLKILSHLKPISLSLTHSFTDLDMDVTIREVHTNYNLLSNVFTISV
ncbi:hypothetical protein QQP08_011654 [Theobroma cacao]|nr:hypothetical protein QQP08_011654 [Theobroma cacao]